MHWTIHSWTQTRFAEERFHCFWAFGWSDDFIESLSFNQVRYWESRARWNSRSFLRKMSPIYFLEVKWMWKESQVRARSEDRNAQLGTDTVYLSPFSRERKDWLFRTVLVLFFLSCFFSFSLGTMGAMMFWFILRTLSWQCFMKIIMPQKMFPVRAYVGEMQELNRVYLYFQF